MHGPSREQLDVLAPRVMAALSVIYEQAENVEPEDGPRMAPAAWEAALAALRGMP